MAEEGITKKPKFRILIDMDEVVAEFELHLLNIYRAKHPDLPHIVLEDRVGLYGDYQYEELYGRDVADKVRAIFKGPGFFRELPAVPNAIQAVTRLSKMDGIEVFFCTSLPTKTNFGATEKLDWIGAHFGQDWVSRVIITRDKTMVRGDLLIDDKPDIEGTFEKPTWRQVLFTACHNRQVEIDTAQNPLIIARLESWHDEEKLRALVEQCRQEKLVQH